MIMTNPRNAGTGSSDQSNYNENQYNRRRRDGHEEGTMKRRRARRVKGKRRRVRRSFRDEEQRNPEELKDENAPAFNCRKRDIPLNRRTLEDKFLKIPNVPYPPFKAVKGEYTVDNKRHDWRFKGISTINPIQKHIKIPDQSLLIRYVKKPNGSARLYLFYENFVPPSQGQDQGGGQPFKRAVQIWDISKMCNRLHVENEKGELGFLVETTPQSQYMCPEDDIMKATEQRKELEKLGNTGSSTQRRPDQPSDGDENDMAQTLQNAQQSGLLAKPLRTFEHTWLTFKIKYPDDHIAPTGINTLLLVTLFWIKKAPNEGYNDNGQPIENAFYDIKYYKDTRQHAQGTHDDTHDDPDSQDESEDVTKDDTHDDDAYKDTQYDTHHDIGTLHGAKSMADFLDDNYYNSERYTVANAPPMQRMVPEIESTVTGHQRQTAAVFNTAFGATNNGNLGSYAQDCCFNSYDSLPPPYDFNDSPPPYVE
eukprot:Nk52_evm2s2402 gene=Nk52_evmTU2s2402